MKRSLIAIVLCMCLGGVAEAQEMSYPDLQTGLSSMSRMAQVKDGKEKPDTTVLNIRTDAFGQVQTLLTPFMDTTSDSIKVEGPVDASDFEAVHSYIMKNGLGVLDLSDAQIINQAIPDSALFSKQREAEQKMLSIKEIVLPEGITGIGKAAFPYSHLEKINIPVSIRKIGDMAFTYDFYLNCSIVIPDGVEEIGNHAFMLCSALPEAPELPATLKRIGDYAFYNTCFSSITLPDGLEAIGEGAFERSRLTSVYIPDSCLEIGIRAFNSCVELEEMRLPDGLTDITEGMAGMNHKLGKISINSACESIGADAFTWCITLSEVEFNEGLRSIGIRAFNGCKIETLCLPSTLTAIGPYAFLYNIPKMKAVYCMAETPPVCERDQEGSNEPFTVETMTEATLFVPVGTAGKYRGQWGWSSFRNIVETDSFPSAGVVFATSEETGEDMPVYDLSGKIATDGSASRIVIKEGKKYISHSRH